MKSPSTIIAQGAEAIIILKENQIIKRRLSKSYRLPILDEQIRKLRTRSESKILEKASKIIPAPKVLKTDEKTKEIIIEFIDGKKLSENLDNFPIKEQKQIMEQLGQSVAKLHNGGIIHGDLTTSNMIYVLDNEFEDNKNKLDKNDKLTCNIQNKTFHEAVSILTTSKNSVNEVNTICTEGAKGGREFSREENPESKSKNPSESSSWWGIPDGGTKSVQDNFKIFFIDFGLSFHSQKYEDKAVDIHLLRQALEAKHFTHWEELYKEFISSYKKTSKDDEKVLMQLEKVEKRGRYKEH